MKYFLYPFLLFHLLVVKSVFADIIVERPSKDKDNLSYFLYPVAYTVPGVGTGYGAGFSWLYGDFNATIVKISGEWDFQSLALIDIPLFTKHFTLSFAGATIDKGTFTMYDRGIESSKEPILDVELESSQLLGLELSLYFSEKQLQLYWGYSANIFKVKSIKERKVKSYEEAVSQDANMYKILNVFKPVITRLGVKWDNTDDDVDPREGFTVGFERYTSGLWGGGRMSDALNFEINDYSWTHFVDMNDKQDVFVYNLFLSEAVSSQKDSRFFSRENESEINECIEEQESGREGKKEGYDPEIMTTLEYCLVQNEGIDRYLRLEKNDTMGSTTLGGANRLRSYPVGRFWDSNTAFVGMEYRFYFAETTKDFDWVIEKGLFNALQLAVFLDLGSVSRTKTFERFKYSTGVGFRIILGGVILRLDYATGEEGNQTTAFFGNPF